MNIDNISMWATAVSGYLFVVLTAGAWFRWWFRHNIKEVIAELRPNSGSSIKDKIDTNTARLERLEQRVDQIYIIISEK